MAQRQISIPQVRMRPKKNLHFVAFDSVQRWHKILCILSCMSATEEHLIQDVKAFFLAAGGDTEEWTQEK